MSPTSYQAAPPRDKSKIMFRKLQMRNPTGHSPVEELITRQPIFNRRIHCLLKFRQPESGEQNRCQVSGKRCEVRGVRCEEKRHDRKNSG